MPNEDKGRVSRYLKKVRTSYKNDPMRGEEEGAMLVTRSPLVVNAKFKHRSSCCSYLGLLLRTGSDQDTPLPSDIVSSSLAGLLYHNFNVQDFK